MALALKILVEALTVKEGSMTADIACMPKIQVTSVGNKAFKRLHILPLIVLCTQHMPFLTKPCQVKQQGGKEELTNVMVSFLLLIECDLSQYENCKH